MICDRWDHSPPSHCPFINSRCWLVLADERVDSRLALGRWTDLLSESDRYITPAVMHIARVYPGSCQFSSSALHLRFYHSLSCVGTGLSLLLSVYLLISFFFFFFSTSNTRCAFDLIFGLCHLRVFLYPFSLPHLIFVCTFIMASYGRTFQGTLLHFSIWSKISRMDWMRRCLFVLCGSLRLFLHDRSCSISTGSLQSGWYDSLGIFVYEWTVEALQRRRNSTSYLMTNSKLHLPLSIHCQL